MNDFILDRINYDPKAALDPAAAHHPNKLVPVPFPAAYAPEPQTTRVDYLVPGSALPKADGVLVTWTVAEKEALFDVLAPIAPEYTYAHLFDTFAPDLTGRSPAKAAGCLGTYRIVGCAGKTYLLFHSNLHLATDGPSLPLRRLFAQIIEETQCQRIITTGTAGGISGVQDTDPAQLGDVAIGDVCHFNCAREFKNAPFAHASYATSIISDPIYIKPYIDPGDLIAANWAMLASQVTRPWAINVGHIETTDRFAFDTSTDQPFGLRAYDPAALVVEMDDSVLGLAIADVAAAGLPVPLWYAIRNASDPTADMAKYATEEEAAKAMSEIYEHYGYATTIPSAIVSWLTAVCEVMPVYQPPAP